MSVDSAALGTQLAVPRALSVAAKRSRLTATTRF
jgi:hypothetical protein